MPPNERLVALHEEFEAGTNPVVFVPYAAALRRERLYLQAIEVCLRGLSRHPASVAGRTLLGRLYSDIGNYAESRNILERVHSMSPDASGVRAALARTYLRMHEVEKVRELLDILNVENPLDPEVQLMNTALRQLLSRRSSYPSTPEPRSVAPVPSTPETLLAAFAERLGTAVRVAGGILLSLSGVFETVRWGRVQALREISEAFREIHRACDELEMGAPRSGEFILELGVILFACRGEELLMLHLETSERMGRPRALFDEAVALLFPPLPSDDSLDSEVQV